MKKFLVVKDWKKYVVNDVDISKLTEELKEEGFLTESKELILAEIDNNGEFCDYRSYDERNANGEIERNNQGFLQRFDFPFF